MNEWVFVGSMVEFWARVSRVGMFSNHFFGYLRLTPRNQSYSAPEFKAHYLETTSISDLDFSKPAARASIVPRALDFCSTPSVGPCHLEISGNMGYWCQPLCCKLVYLCEFMGNNTGYNQKWTVWRTKQVR